MNNNIIKRCLPALLAITFCTTQALAGKAKKEVYIPMDYSTCGYHASELAIPDVQNAVYVASADGDSYGILQRAIDYVSKLKPDAYGRRGAILLGEGTFYIGQPLRVKASGVVLRGSGRGKTTIVKRGVDRGALIYIEGGMSMTGGDTIALSGDKVKAGAVTLTLAEAGGLKAGDRVRIIRPSTKEWIESLACHDFGGGLD